VIVIAIAFGMLFLGLGAQMADSVKGVMPQSPGEHQTIRSARLLGYMIMSLGIGGAAAIAVLGLPG
jgi:hypothetical protein